MTQTAELFYPSSLYFNELNKKGYCSCKKN